ncbi:DUF58 domain-containing protein [Paenibacillus sp. Marseille-Q7038]
MWRTMISPLVMILLMGLLFTLYQLQGGETLLFLLVSSMILTGYGVLAQLIGPRRVHITREFQPGRVTAGERAEVRMRVTINCWVPLLWLKIEEEAAPFKHTQIIFPGKRSYDSSYSYHLKAVHRGVYSYEHCKITWGDAFGWFTCSRRVHVPGELIVHPSFHQSLPGLQVEGYGESLYQQQARNSVVEEWKGYEVREYTPRDGFRSIHWKSSARTGKLQVRIPEKSEDNKIYFLLDNGIDSYMHKGKDQVNELSWNAYDSAISLCASMLRSAYNKGVTPHLITYFVQSGKAVFQGDIDTNATAISTVKMLHQLDFLARLEPGAGLRNTLDVSLPAGSEVYMVTGSLNEQNSKLARELNTQGVRVRFYEMIDWKKNNKAHQMKENVLAAELEKEQIRVKTVASFSEIV